MSLSPSTTEAVFALSAGANLVGRSRYCDYPSEVASLPVVGGFSDPSIETVLALRPSLVIGAHGPAGPGLEEKLRTHGIDTYFPETESFAQVSAMLAGLGAKIGRASEAAGVIRRIEEQKESIVRATKDEPLPRVLMLFDVAPIVVAGPGGFPDELMRLAHGDNVIKEGGAYPAIGLERLIALDPEVLLDGMSGSMQGPSPLAAKRDAAGWKSLQALTKNRVYVLDSEVLRPGPRIAEGLLKVARMLHGAAKVP